jgi:hypothetical protein
MASTLTPITLKGTVNAILVLSTYDVSDGTGMELAGRTFSVEITNIFQQGIFDDSTRQESQYNGIDVSVGHYISDVSGDTIYRIIRISNKTNASVSCVVEDIEMLSYRINGNNLFGVGQPAVIFAANSENEPMISVNQFSDGTVWATDALNKISTRFKLTEYDDRAKFTHSSAPNLSLGDIVTINASGDLVRMHEAGANAIPLGTVFEILRGGLDIYVKPFNDIINQYNNPEELTGSIGDIYYTDSLDPGKITTTQDGPAVYLQISEAEPTVVTGTSSNLPGASDVFIINETTVFDGPSGDSVADMTALVNLINGFTADTNVSASQISEIASTTTGDVTPTFQGHPAFADDMVIPVQQTGQTNPNPPQLEISDGTNSVTVTFNNPNTTGGPFDIYDSAAIFTTVDTALSGSSVQITATQTTVSAGSGILLTANNSNVSIVLTSLVNDILGNNLINDLGLNATSNPIGPSLVLTRSSGGIIEIQGSPVQGGYINSNGIVSSGLGTPPRLLLLEGIGDAGVTTVGVATDDDLDQVPNVTSSDGDATGVFISHTPFGDGLVQVTVNGLASNLGDGVTTTSCYFSADGGTTARAMADIEGGDQLYWNGSIAGYELDGSDLVDVIYDKPSA